MTLLPLADGARLLGIHPKTLCHWLKTAHLPLVAHPTDARIRCVVQADLLQGASLHARPLPERFVGTTQAQDTGAARTAARPRTLSLQQHLVGLTLHLLHAETGDAQQQLQSLEALMPQPLVALQARVDAL